MIKTVGLLEGTEAVDVTRAKLTRQLAERTTHKMQVHSIGAAHTPTHTHPHTPTHTHTHTQLADLADKI